MSTANRDRPDALSVPEILRIMDVATAIRQDREIVEEQLNLDELKARLRDRMIAASKVTGEEVTPEQVDLAISRYYSSLYEFHEPDSGLPLFLAHFWVRRFEILQWGCLTIGLIFLTWWMFLSRSGPLTLTGRTHKRVEALAVEVAKQREAITAVSRDPAVNMEVTRITTEAETYRRQADPTKLETVRSQLSSMERRLREEYTVTVLGAPGGRSAVRKAFRDGEGKRELVNYVIVEAKTPDGTILRRRVHDQETDQDVDVAQWAERIPSAVYDRLGKDKNEDGILNETTFSIKRKGFADEEIIMPGSDGRPITRAGQITKW